MSRRGPRWSVFVGGLPLAALVSVLAVPVVAAFCPIEEAFGAVAEAVLLSASWWLLLLGSVCALGALVRTRRPWWGGLALVQVLPLVTGWFWNSGEVPEGEGVRVVSANLQAWAEPPQIAEMEHALADLSADVLVTIERRAENVPGMRRVADNFDRPLGAPSWGSAGFCREGLECEGSVSGLIGTERCRFPIVSIRVEGALCIVGAHFPPPVPTCVAGRAPYLETMLTHLSDGRVSSDWGACKTGDPVVVVGDLNTAPGGSIQRALISGGGLRDVLPIPAPLAGTWPNGGGYPPLPFFRLDHVLVGDASGSGFVGGGLPGSDHRWVGARISNW